jgi:hypothetical protein
MITILQMALSLECYLLSVLLVFYDLTLKLKEKVCPVFLTILPTPKIFGSSRFFILNSAQVAEECQALVPFFHSILAGCE